jgi:hypothetical protein
VDKALYETSLRGNPRKILDIYGESSFEAGNDGDFNEQESYFIKTPSNPFLYEISLDSLSLSLTLPHMRSSTPSCSLFLRILKGWFKRQSKGNFRHLWRIILGS